MLRDARLAVLGKLRCSDKRAGQGLLCVVHVDQAEEKANGHARLSHVSLCPPSGLGKMEAISGYSSCRLRILQHGIGIRCVASLCVEQSARSRSGDNGISEDHARI